MVFFHRQESWRKVRHNVSNHLLKNELTYCGYNTPHEILWPVLCKKWGFSWNLTYFLFLLWISFTWNWRKNVYIFLNFLASKVKLADGFMDETGIKLWNRQIRSGKKKNWNWRHQALPRPSLSFFFPIESGRFQNFSQFHLWNHSQFHFWTKKSEKILDIFRQFHVKLITKKK